MRNGARKRVLSLVNGAFSERFYKISVACGLETDKLDAPLGQGFSADQLAAALKGKDYDAVTVGAFRDGHGRPQPHRATGESRSCRRRRRVARR